MSELVSGLVAFSLGSIGTYLATQWKVRAELEGEYDQSLRDARIRVYQELWASLQPLAQYARPGPVTYQAIHQLTTDLRAWYFEKGGLYFSDKARDAYFALQEALAGVQSKRPATMAIQTELEDATVERLRQQGSALRTAMAADVGTRRAPLLALD
jgi:hypothetical protein